MKIAVVHAHFRRGGVTRVVENAATALTARGHAVVAFSGEAYHGDQLPRHVVAEGLGYENSVRPGAGEALARRLVEKAREAFGGDPDCWHLHNHSLGKNVNFPATLRALAATGARLLLQIHDFAKDGRPANYSRLRAAYPDSETFSAVLYPAAPQIHYAALNGRDRELLRAAGIPSDRLHLLPNPIAVPSLAPSDRMPLPEIERLLLYPTRAIRRKNVGELLLHAALAPAGTVLATTLIPENPEWLAAHRGWEALAAELALPVRFGVGHALPFADLIHQAEALLTTSVAEGFGLAFLEPTLFGKPVVGRNLPEITADFSAWGIDLGHLYDTLPVPRECVPEAALRAAVETALARLARAYHTPAPPRAPARALAAFAAGERAWDFGRLDEPLQAAVIRAARATPERFDAIEQALAPPADGLDLATAREALSAELGLPAYGERLEGVFRDLLDAPTESPGAHDAPAILQQFLAPERLFLLRA